MKQKKNLHLVAWSIAGLLLYMGLSKLMDYTILKKQIAASAFRRPEKTKMKGKLLPSFDMLLPDSSTYFNTNEIPVGKPVVFFYFSPECPYCQAQMKEIIKEINQLKDIQFYVLTPFPFSEMKIFYEQYQLKKYLNITTGIDYKNFFGDYFKTQSVPYIAIYGKDRLFNEAFLGNIDSKQIKVIAEE
ncbi:thioredoxin-like protein [Chitinophaga niastensis]|uniref:Thioredoxin-like protein n=1 Tax=Chitinophaga niastensis TaxID=536980 RepID=A0A2P8HQ49_CHINA|nr:thioredoxin fold domain-containing protein [Chitinophaga niastensis]PSL48363.1 thioredoxin-like protein [Chitinophaga niastensis]